MAHNIEKKSCKLLVFNNPVRTPQSPRNIFDLFVCNSKESESDFNIFMEEGIQ